MSYVGSYLWRVRQALGSDLVLMPGAMIALQRGDGHVLITKRADDWSWCLPAGAAEVEGSFAQTAIDELAEETGIEVAADDLIPFATLSEAEEHTIHYPNGDVTHCFAVCFLASAYRVSSIRATVGPASDFGHTRLGSKSDAALGSPRFHDQAGLSRPLRPAI